jgi:hypothetical protein
VLDLAGLVLTMAIVGFWFVFGRTKPRKADADRRKDKETTN